MMMSTSPDKWGVDRSDDDRVGHRQQRRIYRVAGRGMARLARGE